LRASLASATSLLAILLLNGGQAAAVPIISLGTSTPYYRLDSTWEAGAGSADAGDASASYTFTPLTTGTTTSTASHSGTAPYARATQAALASQISSHIREPVLTGLHRNSRKPGFSGGRCRAGACRNRDRSGGHG
jgi:hypothetical protein